MSGPRVIGAAVGAVVVGAVVATLLLAGQATGSSASTRVGGGAHTDRVITLAGTGRPGFNGDGHEAVDTQLDAPAAVAEDASGDLFIADTGNCRVREVPARTGDSFGHQVRAGHITTIVGGPCTGPRPNPAPTALAVDPAGDLFVSNGPTDRVEEIPARSGTQFGVALTVGRLATLAGDGRPGFEGDGRPAGRSELDDPSGVAVDPTGDLLVADTGNCRVRLVAASSGTRYGLALVQGHIYTVAGTGTCGSSGDGGPARLADVWDPGALGVDPEGDVFVADQGNRTIRVLTSHPGTFYGVPLAADDLGTVAGEGSYGPYLVDGLAAVGETSELNFPTGIALDDVGDLYVADGEMHAIRLVPARTVTLLGQPAQADDLYTAAGAMLTGSLRTGTAWIETHLLDPEGLAVAPSGTLVYSDSQADVVRMLPAGS